ncbi:MAG: hypothetical protein IJB68_04345 [Ruminococcus sp.]|nr:hypothetical protein [Ruminococcus sp.]
MDKEKILEMSRKENKNKDIADLETEKKASANAIMIGSIFAGILWFWQVFTNNGTNDSILAIIMVMCAVIHYSKYASLKTKKYLFCAICWTFSSVVFTLSTIIGFYN